MARAATLGCVLYVVLLSAGASAAEPPLLTLAWALKTMRTANPEVRALAAERTAAWERVPQAQALDDPSVAVQLWGFPFTRQPGAGSMVMVQISQPLPFPGKRALRAEVAGASARVAGEAVRSRQVELVAEVKRLYYQLWINRAARGINARNQELLEQMRRAALARVATSTGSVTDVLRIETERARLRADVANLTRDRQILAGALNARLGREAVAPLGEPVDDFAPPTSSRYAVLLDAAGRQRPDLQASRIEAGRAESQVALARRNRYPDFMPMVMFMQDIEMGPAWGATLGISVPIWSGQRQGRAVREMSAAAVAARDRQRAARLEVERQVREALASFETAVERLHLLRDEVIPKARASLASIRADYVAARETLTALLDGRRVLQDLELEEQRGRAEVEQARAELERAVGGTLP
jgi:outer membrane protein, heavy metal efflux system